MELCSLLWFVSGVINSVFACYEVVVSNEVWTGQQMKGANGSAIAVLKPHQPATDGKRARN